MRSDIYTKAVLTVIAIMLAVIAFKPLILNETTHAATHQYSAVSTYGRVLEDGSIQQDLDKGGDLVTAMVTKPGDV